MSSPARNSYLDLLRVIGTVAVVAGHLPVFLLPRSAIYSWHVPIFFVLSGYLVSRRDVRAEIGRRLSSLATPYAAWVLVVFAVFVPVALSRGGATTRELVSPLLGGRWATAPFSAVWFVSALFVAAVVARLIDATGWGWPPRFGAVLALAVGMALAPSAVSHLPLGVSQGLACVVFVQVGALAAAYLRPRAGRTRALVGSVAVAGAVVVFATGLGAPLDLKALSFGTPVISAVASTALCVGVTILPIRISGRVGGAITALAQTSLAVIFLHSLVLWLWPGTTPSWWLLILATVPAWLVGFALSLTPLAATFGCARTPRRLARHARA